MFQALTNLARGVKHGFAGQTGDPSLIRWKAEFSDSEWRDFILWETREWIKRGATTVVILGQTEKANDLVSCLLTKSAQPVTVYVLGSTTESAGSHSLKSLVDLASDPKHTVFVSPYLANHEVTAGLQLLHRSPTYSSSAFINKIRAFDSYSALAKYGWGKPYFVSSLFDNDGINSIYEYSLTKVEQKCDVRDAYDLYQSLLQTKEVPGAIAEFGSYRGHSGLIIAEAARRLKLGKSIYLCDMFERFPTESQGVDRFWSETHDVDFEEVSRVFGEYPEVKLVKGDFADTIDSLPETDFSFVHVDCDSYRGTRLVIEKVFPKLSRGGVMAFEDYGHDFCLGARLAVDEFFNSLPGCFRFFSGFSGLQIVCKWHVDHRAGGGVM